MMKNLTRLLAIGLVLCSLLLCACQKGNETEVTTEDGANTGEANYNANAMFQKIYDNHPAKMDFGGELINVAVRNETRYNYEFIVEGGASNSGIVSRAIYERNLAAEDRMNVMVQYNPIGGGHGPWEDIENSILGGVSLYDVAIGSAAPSNAQAIKGTYKNLRNIDSLDMSKEYWAQDMLESMTYADATYFATGSISTYFYDSAYVIYFNKNLCSTWGIDPNTVYETVLEGGWTLEHMINLTKDIYADSNGNGQVDDGDTFGFGLQVTSAVDGFTSACGITMTEMNNDRVSYVVDINRAVSVVEKLSDFLWGNDGTIAYVENKVYVEPERYLFDRQFVNDQVLFVTDWLYSTSSTLRDMKSDFGVLPYPKYAETEEYATYVHDKFSVVGIPNSVDSGRTTMIGTLLEVMASGGQNTVMPAYYERALTSAYIRDPQSVETMAIIVENMSNDRIWFLDTGNASRIIRPPVRYNTDDVVSTYRSIYDLVNQNIANTYENYDKYSGN